MLTKKEKIEQVLTNLIDNSLKYGKDNGTTEVMVQNLNEFKIIVRITDNGVGLEEEKITPEYLKDFLESIKVVTEIQGDRV